MRGRILYYIVGAGIVFFAWQKHRQKIESAVSGEDPASLLVERPNADAASRFQCDGRVYCSQMTSCEEATWFLQHCPGVKMDGEGDGVPCEKQWCGRR